MAENNMVELQNKILCICKAIMSRIVARIIAVYTTAQQAKVTKANESIKQGSLG